MSVYKVIGVIGTSSMSWEDAAAEAVKTAAESIRDLRVAEVVKQDNHLDESGGITYRTTRPSCLLRRAGSSRRSCDRLRDPRPGGSSHGSGT